MESPRDSTDEDFIEQIAMADAYQNRVQPEHFSGTKMCKFVRENRNDIAPQKAQRGNDRTRASRQTETDLSEHSSKRDYPAKQPPSPATCSG